MAGALRMNIRCAAITLAAWAAFASAASEHDTANNLEWVHLSGGCFSAGSSSFCREEAPAHERCVDDFAMLRTEVTNAQFAQFVNATGYVTDAERGWSFETDASSATPGSAVFVMPQNVDASALNWWHFTPGAHWRKPIGPNGPDAMPTAPVVHVTINDAEAFADWAGGRLPTEPEWEFAARNTREIADAHNANTWQGLFPLVDSGKDGFTSVAPVGSFSPNPQGLYDMLGNVWELTASPYAPSHEPSAIAIAGQRGFDPSQPKAEVVVIKGGSFLCARNFC